MNLAEFTMLLESHRGAGIITLTGLTTPDWLPLRDTGPNPYRGKVLKRAVVNGMFNWQYEAAVNRQRVREGKEPDFDAIPRKWGTRIRGTPWVAYKGMVYLELKRQNVYEVGYLGENLEPVPDAANYVKPDGNNPRQELDNEIILRDYRLDHIIAIAYRGESHVIAA